MSGCQESLMSEDVPVVNPIISTEKSVREIPLTQGKVALVDEDDYEWLNQWKWCTKTTDKSDLCYAIRSIWNHGDYYMSRMHREILNIPRNNRNIMVDHINRNGLDNRKTNLRIVPPFVNCINSGMFKNNTSGYKGVYWNKKGKKWQARISKNGIRIFISQHQTSIEAAIAYNETAIKLWGNNAYLNKL